MNVEPLRSQMPDVWQEILNGLQDPDFLVEVTVELARPQLGRRSLELLNRWLDSRLPDGSHPPGALEAWRAATDPLDAERRRNDLTFRHLLERTPMTILWQRAKVDQYVDEQTGQTVTYPLRGYFLCRLASEAFPYGFFDARRGSCGFNGCPVGQAYGAFYVGTWDDIWQYAMTDKHRRWLEQDGWKDKLD